MYQYLLLSAMLVVLFFREHVTKFFPILNPFVVLLRERLSVPSATGIKISATPLPILVTRHGRFRVAVLCSLVECMAFFGLVYSYGVQGYVDVTLPLLGSRVWVVCCAALSHVASYLYSLCRKLATYILDTAVGGFVLRLKRPVFLVVQTTHSLLSLLLGEGYIGLTLDHIKGLLSFFTSCALGLARRKVYAPCRAKLDEKKRSSLLVDFICKRAFELFALLVWGLSMVVAFVFVYAVDRAHFPPLPFEVKGHGDVFSKDAEELDDGNVSEEEEEEPTLGGVELDSSGDESEETVWDDAIGDIKGLLDIHFEEALPVKEYEEEEDDSDDDSDDEDYDDELLDSYYIPDEEWDSYYDEEEEFEDELGYDEREEWDTYDEEDMARKTGTAGWPSRRSSLRTSFDQEVVADGDVMDSPRWDYGCFMGRHLAVEVFTVSDAEELHVAIVEADAVVEQRARAMSDDNGDVLHLRSKRHSINTLSQHFIDILPPANLDTTEKKEEKNKTKHTAS
ncbi:hypothetical protein CPC08DRAFT_785922 [Agrocybe pediades]|nr:hypothetical protein CPC08DRAFT_785922 [Agrocybe pediades]